MEVGRSWIAMTIKMQIHSQNSDFKGVFIKLGQHMASLYDLFLRLPWRVITQLFKDHATEGVERYHAAIAG